MRLIHVFVHERREMAVRRTLADLDVDEETYTVIMSVEATLTPNAEKLNGRRP